MQAINSYNPGKMYEVNINADPDHFLDWDKPLSEQSDHVKGVLKAGKWAAVGPDASDTGAEFMKGLAPEDHLQLGKEGLPGIKYLDQGSRDNSHAVQLTYKGQPYQDPMKFPTNAQAENWAAEQRAKGFGADVSQLGTRNYVVFNDKLIDIVKKYGMAGLVAGGAAHFSTQPVDHDPFQ